MTTTPSEPVEDPQKVPAGDGGVADAPTEEPDAEETVGPGVND